MTEDYKSKIVQGIWDDIMDRCGGDRFLGDLDEEIEQEIKDAWRLIISSILKDFD